MLPIDTTYSVKYEIGGLLCFVVVCIGRLDL